MLSSPLNTNIGQAIDRGYLKSLDNENINGYKCYQFYSIDYPWKDVPKPLFPFGSKTKECRSLNVKLYVKDGIDIDKAPLAIKTDCERDKGYGDKNNIFLNLFIDDQPSKIEIDFTTALVQSNRLPVNIHINNSFIYNNRDNGDFHISMEGLDHSFNSFEIRDNEKTKLSIGNNVKIKELLCTSNKNVSLFVDESVDSVKFIKIIPQNLTSKNRYAIGIGLDDRQEYQSDLAKEASSLKEIRISNIKLSSKKDGTKVERTYRLGFHSSLLRFEDVDVSFSYPNELLDVKDGKAFIPLYIENIRDNGEMYFKKTQLNLSGSISFDSNRVQATWSDTVIDISSSDSLVEKPNLIKASNVDFGYNSKIMLKNTEINIDEGNGGLDFHNSNGFFDSTISIYNVAGVFLGGVHTNKSYIYKDFEEKFDKALYLSSLNIEHTEFRNCTLPSSSNNFINCFVTPIKNEDGDEVEGPIEGRVILLDNCDLSKVRSFKISVDNLDPYENDKAMTIKNSKFDSEEVSIIQYKDTKTSISNTIFTEDESILFLNKDGKNGSSYEINNSVIGGNVSIDVGEINKIDNSVIKDSKISSDENLNIFDSTVTNSELSGYSSIEGVCVVNKNTTATTDKRLITKEISSQNKEANKEANKDIEFL